MAKPLSTTDEPDDQGEEYVLTPEQEADVTEAVESVERGESIPAERFWHEIDAALASRAKQR